VDRVLQELDQKQTKSKKKDNPLKAVIKNNSKQLRHVHS
jgi:hypothetical protein